MARTPPQSASLVWLCRAQGLPEPVTELRFHPSRRWRFDLAWPGFRVALERQGGTWSQGRHSRATGYRADCEKLAEAQILGWLVLYATSDMIQDGLALTLLRRALESRGWTPEKESLHG